METINIIVNETVETVAVRVSDGNNGLSAYQQWIMQGNTGTVQDFLNSLIGDPLLYDYLTAEQKSDLTKDSFKIASRLAELDSEQAKYDARQNLGLNIIDGGTFN